MHSIGHVGGVVVVDASESRVGGVTAGSGTSAGLMAQLEARLRVRRRRLLRLVDVIEPGTACASCLRTLVRRDYTLGD